MEISQKFRNIVRAAIGLPAEPGQPPQLDRLAWYRAQVVAWASDGSTCDVQCEDSRIGGVNGVKVLVGIPGITVVVSVGVVMLGWERGDPNRPRCIPIFEAGATVSKLKFTGTEIDIGSNAHPLALWDTFESDLVQVLTDLLVGTVGGPTKQVLANQANISAMITKLQGGNYNSTVVKNG